MPSWDNFILFSGRKLRRRPELPSYSWAGWKGSLRPFPPSDGSISKEVRLRFCMEGDRWHTQRKYEVWRLPSICVALFAFFSLTALVDELFLWDGGH